MSFSHTVFVTAASGHIGQELVPLLLKTTTHKVVLPTSRAAKLNAQVASLGLAPDIASRAVIVEGDIKDPLWVQEQCQTHGVDTAFLCLTGSDELFTTCTILEAFKAARIKHLVYLSAWFEQPNTGADISGTLGMWGLVAHGLVKVAIELVLPTLPFTHTVLGPTLFTTNDLRAKPALVEPSDARGGAAFVPRAQPRLIEPLGNIGSSRVFPYDIACAAVRCIDDAGKRYNKRKIVVGSLKSYNKAELERVWTAAFRAVLGESSNVVVTMAECDAVNLDRLEEHIRAARGPAWAKEIRAMYEAIAEYGFGPNETQYAEQVELLGREPMDYEAWVHETARSWLG
ncbi:NAD(P)-binding protein [Fistulina hepatica ATCC 64428]|uniref:NAD(P)-binding protein n=1 Tax=Fistulina hepatica ATCC 64428 TaxID=1128425 RepID=A0A0D7A885_9AGAR|nr:NAD(P)-binding protein [Fistulina hepatica ATCC 64428]